MFQERFSGKNFWQIQKEEKDRVFYGFIDVEESFADEILYKNNVKPIFYKTIKNDDIPYLIQICSVAITEKEKFIQSMDELYHKMLVHGYPNYPEACKEILASLEQRVDEIEF